MLRVWPCIALSLATCLLSATASFAEPTSDSTPTKSESPEAEPTDFVKKRPFERIEWQTDYSAAVQQAKEQRRMLLILFQRPGDNSEFQAFEKYSLPMVSEQHLEHFVWAKLPTSVTIQVGGKDTRVLSHQAFTYMYGQQGIAILDFANPGTRHYGYVVSQFPFKPRRYYTPREFSEVLNLPAGTLTQRTMIYAVRTYPDHPQSAVGQLSPVLASEAESHSRHQASITLQGHHSWDSRFHRINASLGGMVSTEVVAESWPGEQLVDAAIECVHSWRQSPGHWSAVRKRHRVFGFDIKPGRNGIWYATGIFGNRR